MKQVILSFAFLFLYFPICIGQGSSINNPGEQDLAIQFVNRMKGIIDSNNLQSFIPDLVVTNDELRTFLDQEFKRKYGKRGFKKIQEKFGHPVDPYWEFINANEGFDLTSPFIRNKNMVTDEKEFHPTFVNAKFSDIQVNSVEQYNRDFGEISKLKIFVITADLVTSSNPIYEYKASFPCILTEQNDFKLVGKMKGEFISMKIDN